MTTLDELVAAKAALDVKEEAYQAAIVEKNAAQLDYDSKHADPATPAGDLAIAHDRLDAAIAGVASTSLARDAAQVHYNTVKSSYEAINTPIDHDTAVSNAKLKVAGSEANVAAKKATRDVKSNYLATLPASTSQADVVKAALELATANSELAIAEQELETARQELANAEAAREAALPISLDQAVVLATNAYSEAVQNRVNAKKVLDEAKEVEVSAAADRVAKQASYDALAADPTADPVDVQNALDALNVARLAVADADAVRVQAQAAFNAAVAAADQARATMKLAKEKVEQAQAAADANAADQAKLDEAARLIEEAKAEASRILAEAQAVADQTAANAVDDAIDDVVTAPAPSTPASPSNTTIWLVAIAIVVAVAIGSMYFMKMYEAKQQALLDSIEQIKNEQVQASAPSPVVSEVPTATPDPSPSPTVVETPIPVVVDSVVTQPVPETRPQCNRYQIELDGRCYNRFRAPMPYGPRPWGYSASAD